MAERRICPDHIFVSIGSSQGRMLARAMNERVIAEIAGFEVWVTQRTEVSPPGEPVQARFDLATLAAETQVGGRRA